MPLMGTFAKIQMLKSFALGLLFDVGLAAFVSLFLRPGERGWGFIATLFAIWVISSLMHIRKWLKTLVILGLSQGALERDYVRMLSGTGIPGPDPRYNNDPVDYLAWVADDSNIDPKTRVTATAIMMGIKKDGDQAGFIGALLIRNAAMKALMRIPR